MRSLRSQDLGRDSTPLPRRNRVDPRRTPPQGCPGRVRHSPRCSHMTRTRSLATRNSRRTPSAPRQCSGIGTSPERCSQWPLRDCCRNWRRPRRFLAQGCTGPRHRPGRRHTSRSPPFSCNCSGPIRTPRYRSGRSVPPGTSACAACAVVPCRAGAGSCVVARAAARQPHRDRGRPAIPQQPVARRGTRASAAGIPVWPAGA